MDTDYNLGPVYGKSHTTFSRIDLDAPPALIAKWLDVMVGQDSVLVVKGQYNDSFYAALPNPPEAIPEKVLVEDVPELKPWPEEPTPEDKDMF